jgi:HD superfamily phosphohydrolase
MSLDTRECNDIVHTSVSIPPAVQIILDSPPVQRLVNLKQLGCAFNTYPCATHTRKEHSLGVMELAGKVGIHLQSEQPTLGITDKDILCLRMAGLCHDLGHGPNSHVYESFLKAVYKNEHDHPELYEERDRQFKSEFGIDMPPLPRHYEHERTSLMMIDFALASVGLEIDWNRLDEPLKQIGNGIDCDKFGVVGRNTNDECIPFTSRDWIFIKECIMATPLDTPDAPSRQLTFIGRPEKEYLYDIVSNRYSGLDVDKIDYYDRDSLAAFGSKRGELQVFLREATVAWGKCPDIKQSYKCMSHPIDPELNLMICYPSKLVEAAMDFFSQRKKNHAAIVSVSCYFFVFKHCAPDELCLIKNSAFILLQYTHKKTKAAECKFST